MRKKAPIGLLAGTVACFILLNLLVAQWIIMTFYPQAVARLGPAALIALAVVLVACLAYVARGWRTYLRRSPDA